MVSELEDLNRKKTAYMENFISKGFSVADLSKDETFLQFLETESKLIEKRNKSLKYYKKSLVNDTKGITVDFLKQSGYRVDVLDLNDKETFGYYNPEQY